MKLLIEVQVRYTTDSGKYPLPIGAYYVYMWASGV
jgi:hypothetical protein